MWLRSSSAVIAPLTKGWNGDHSLSCVSPDRGFFCGAARNGVAHDDGIPRFAYGGANGVHEGARRHSTAPAGVPRDSSGCCQSTPGHASNPKNPKILARRAGCQPVASRLPEQDQISALRILGCQPVASRLPERVAQICILAQNCQNCFTTDELRPIRNCCTNTTQKYVRIDGWYVYTFSSRF